MLAPEDDVLQHESKGGVTNYTGIDGVQCFADVAAYSAFDSHRTGSPSDAATIDWLRDRLPSDFDVAEQPFIVKKYFDYAGCDLFIDGQGHECFGVWLPNATQVRHLRAARGTTRLALSARLAVVDVSSPSLGRHGAGKAIETAIELGAAAVAVVNHLAEHRPTHLPPHADWPLVALNAPAPYHQQPWPVPVAVVGSAAAAAMLRAGAIVDRLHVRGTCCTSRTARNLVASLRVGAAAADTSTKPVSWSPPQPPIRLIVSTPTSGWFQCGGERGVGVALWLQLARTLPALLARARRDETARRHARAVAVTSGEGREARPTPVPVPSVEVVLLGTTAHELGYGGAHAMIADVLVPRGFAPAHTQAWIALGASIVTLSGLSTETLDGELEETLPSNDVGEMRRQPSAMSDTTTAGVVAANGELAGAYHAVLDFTDASLAAALQPLVTAGFHPLLNPPSRRGELAPIGAAGYRAFGFYGEHALFHTHADTPNSTSPDLLERVAAPTLAAISTIINDALLADDAATGRTAATTGVGILTVAAADERRAIGSVLAPAMPLVVVLYAAVWLRPACTKRRRWTSTRSPALL